MTTTVRPCILGRIHAAAESNWLVLSDVDTSTVKDLIALTERQIELHLELLQTSQPSADETLTEEKYLQQLRIAIAPHKRVPPEILSTIFMLASSVPILIHPSSIRSAPWIFRSVCSSWRSTALGDQQLWNNFCLPFSQFTEDPEILRKRLSLFNLSALRQSQNLSLSINQSQYYSETTARIEAAYSAIIHTNLPRLQHLEMFVSTPVASMFLLNPENSMPLLETLILNFVVATDAEFDDSPQEKLVSHAPIFLGMVQLRTLNLNFLRWRKRAIIPLSIPWPQLSALELTLGRAVTFNCSLAVRILAQCSGLTWCKLGLHFGEGAAPDQVVNLPQLTHLTLQVKVSLAVLVHYNLLDFLCLPSLNTLSVEHIRHSTSSELLRAVTSLLLRSKCSLRLLNIARVPMFGIAHRTPIPDVLLKLVPNIHTLNTPGIFYPTAILQDMAEGNLFPGISQLQIQGDRDSADILARLVNVKHSKYGTSGLRLALYMPDSGSDEPQVRECVKQVGHCGSKLDVFFYRV